ncbi:MAG: c-type cytochrome [Candidatus Methylomirabilales bacterium]
MRERGWILGHLVIFSFLIVGQGSAGVIDERQALMRAIGDDLQAIWDGLARGDGGAVEQGAKRIAAQAARVSVLFPPDSFHPPSRAEPAIREEFRAFEDLVLQLKEAAQDLAASARHATLAEVQPHLMRLVQTCRQCHRSYIEPY